MYARVPPPEPEVVDEDALDEEIDEDVRDEMVDELRTRFLLIKIFPQLAFQRANCEQPSGR